MAEQWTADILDGFEARRLDFPDDYEGAVYATLVRKRATTKTTRAVLYIHGFMDYFFQTHLAERFNAAGYHFYALDLRKYGRSLAAHQHPNYCHDLSEYFAEISASIRIIYEEEGNEWLLLSGHSTGGLLSSIYAAEGDERGRVKALHLNSPFYDWHFYGTTKLFLMGLGRLAPITPMFGFQPKDPLIYLKSIHRDHHGEWDFNWAWRPLHSYPLFCGWIRAINRAHQRVQRGLGLQIPVALAYSDKSIYELPYGPAYHAADAVLNVEHIKAAAPHLGSAVTHIEIADGLHDLALSREDVRERYFSATFAWLETVSAPVRAAEPGAD